MKDDIKTMMTFSKANIFRDIPDDYVINKDFLCGMRADEAKKGVIAFRDFLYTFFEYIVDNDNEFAPVDKKSDDKKAPSGFIAKYPVLRDLYQALLRIGMESNLSVDTDIRLIVNGKKLSESFKEARMRKIKDSFIHLYAVGFDFGDIDIASKKFKLSDYGEINITYPDNDYVLAGLKIMAEANKAVHPEGASRPVEQILLRCDYHALEGKTIKASGRKAKSIPLKIEECLNFMPGESSRCLLEVNDMLTNKGYKYEGKPINMGYSFVYTSKKKGTVLCTIVTDIEKCRVKVNAENLNKYMDFVKTMPENMYNAVAKNRWDCVKQHNPDACNPRCKGGFKFTLDGVEYSKCRGGSFCMDINIIEDTDILKQWLIHEIENA